MTYLILFELSGQEEQDGQGMLNVWGQEMCIEGFGGDTWGDETIWKS